MIVAAASSVFMDSSNIQGILKVVNAYQLLLLLVCVQVDAPQGYLDALSQFKYTMFNANSLPFELSLNTNIEDAFGTENKELPRLSKIDITFVSTIVNFYSVVVTVGSFLIVHLVFAILRAKLKTYERQQKFICRVIENVYRSMTYGIYIRLIFEVYAFMLLLSLLEVISIYTKIKESLHPDSWILSV